MGSTTTKWHPQNPSLGTVFFVSLCSSPHARLSSRCKTSLSLTCARAHRPASDSLDVSGNSFGGFLDFFIGKCFRSFSRRSERPRLSRDLAPPTGRLYTGPLVAKGNMAFGLTDGVNNGCQQHLPEPPSSRAVEVELRNVSLSYGNKRVLDNINLTIREGEVVALLGPSGTGKSTILRLICGLLMPTSGQVFIRGEPRLHPITEDATPVSSAKISVVFQNPALFDSLSVAENVAFELLEHSDLPESRIAELAMIALERVGLGPEVMGLYPRQLSGGMQKRVSFARSVTYDPNDTDGQCRSPNILLLDEPTAGLDPVVSTRMEDLVCQLQQVCRTCIIVTHSFSTVRRTADRIVFFHDGKIRWDGPVARIDTTDNSYMRQFFSASLDGPMEFQDRKVERWGVDVGGHDPDDITSTVAADANNSTE